MFCYEFKLGGNMYALKVLRNARNKLTAQQRTKYKIENELYQNNLKEINQSIRLIECKIKEDVSPKGFKRLSKTVLEIIKQECENELDSRII